MTSWDTNDRELYVGERMQDERRSTATRSAADLTNGRMHTQAVEIMEQAEKDFNICVCL